MWRCRKTRNVKQESGQVPTSTNSVEVPKSKLMSLAKKRRHEMDVSDTVNNQQEETEKQTSVGTKDVISSSATAECHRSRPRVHTKTTQLACLPPVAAHAHSVPRVSAHAHNTTGIAQEVSSTGALRKPPSDFNAHEGPSKARDADEKLGELRKVAQERESIGEGRSAPTYQAYLAQRGYLLGRTLGCGSYSKVKRATLYRNTSSGSPEKVAVKLVDRSKAPQDYQKKFLPRELQLWPGLSHKHLVSLKEWFEDARRVYMVLEYVEGGDTLRYIQNHGSVPESRARRWTRQTAEAVRYLHDLDISHRDLKLENLLLTRSMDIKVCDFGFIKPSSSSDLSRTYCGSKSYAAPEILLGQPYQPLKADSWAIGVILYIFVVGKMPFDETRGSRHILDEQRRLAFPWTSLPQVSTPCRRIIHRLFTWSFADRPSVPEVLNDPWFKHNLLPDFNAIHSVQGEGDLTKSE